jgi:hypothetical protein
MAMMAPATVDQVQRCEVCERIHQTFFEFLCQFQHAVVTDSRELERFVADGGFCARHFWLYRELAAPKDICVALSPLVMKLSAQLRTAATTAIALCPPPATCRMCLMQQHIENETTAGIVTQASVGDPTRARKPALCMPHLRIISMGLNDPALTTALFNEQARTLERLAEDMQRYALKRDALRRCLTSEEEGRAAEDAVLLVTGRRLITQ